MKTIKILTLALITVIFSACSNDDDSAPAPVNEEEVITTLTVTLVPEDGGPTITMRSQDLDGDGPDAPDVSISGPLAINKTYNGSIVLLNETEEPAENVTTEIAEEDADHQFFFTATNSIATIAYADQDDDGNPVGLNFTATTTAAATGNLTIILRHEPNKSASGVSEGDITNAGGETDIEVTFTGINVQ